MTNFYITQYFDWDSPESPRVRFANRMLQQLGLHARLMSPTQSGEMTSVEQRMNLYHLLSQTLIFDVPGAIVELGSHSGQTAVLFRLIMNHLRVQRDFLVYDAFAEPPVDELKQNFAELCLDLPAIHSGWFEDTVPSELPDQIAFVHLDAGPGFGENGLYQTLLHCLTHIYPRLSPKGVCVLADYADPNLFNIHGYHPPATISRSRFWAHLPGVKRACDEFFADKPEKVESLYGGPYSQGYFRKL